MFRERYVPKNSYSFPSFSCLACGLSAHVSVFVGLIVRGQSDADLFSARLFASVLAPMKMLFVTVRATYAHCLELKFVQSEIACRFEISHFNLLAILFSSRSLTCSRQLSGFSLHFSSLEAAH